MLRHILIGTLAAAIAAPTASAQDTLNRPAEPDGKNGGWISTNDYPDASLRANEQGMTTVEYEIAPTGRVTPGSCKVTASSRYPRLDARTCEIIETRFRFRPALENGRPVASKRTQSVHWSLPTERPEFDLDDIAIRKVHGYAACLVEGDAELSRRIVDAPLGSEEQAAAAKAFKPYKQDCARYRGEVTFPPLLLAGAVAEVLVEQRFGASGLPPLAAEGLAPSPRNGTEALAQCVVRRNPANIRELLETTPTGPAEGLAVRKIVPDLQPCVVAGTTLRLNRVSIRSLFAAGLYREATAAAQTGQVGARH